MTSLQEVSAYGATRLEREENECLCRYFIGCDIKSHVIVHSVLFLGMHTEAVHIDIRYIIQAERQTVVEIEQSQNRAVNPNLKP